MPYGYYATRESIEDHWIVNKTHSNEGDLNE